MRAKALGAIGLLIVAIAGCGRDSSGTMTTSKPTTVVAIPRPAFYKEANSVIATLPAGTTLPVQDLHYGKDYLMLAIELPDGQHGYVDVSDVTWSPEERESNQSVP
jgi:hypothetical protein